MTMLDHADRRGTSPLPFATTSLLLALLVSAGVASLPRASSLSTSSPNPLQRLLLQSGRGKSLREDVVRRYFDGVNKKDRDQIRGCFDATKGATIRDVCGVFAGERSATADELADRCMEFLAAHPDTEVKFHYGPTCGRGTGRWVVAHWYETGTWSGFSVGVEPQNTPLDVEGQTRFFVNDNLKIEKFVVTRTFSEWEVAVQKQGTAKGGEAKAE